MLEKYLDDLYNATQDTRFIDNEKRTKIINKITNACDVVGMPLQNLLNGLDFKSKDLTIEAFEAFCAELRSIFWLKNFGFTNIKPISMGKEKQPDFTAEFANKLCAIEVFCLTQKHEQQKDPSIGVYKNFDPDFDGSKFGRDFMSKASEKKEQLDSSPDYIIKVLLCVVNSGPIIALNEDMEIEQYAKLFFNQLNWGDGYYIGLLTDVEAIYPKLSTTIN